MRNIFLLLIFTLASSCTTLKNGDIDFLKGYFSYFADAAMFIDCKTDTKYPVAMEKDYLALEQEYLKTVQSGGERILVEVEGSFVDRDKIEGIGKRKFLIVNKFLKISPNQNCD